MWDRNRGNGNLRACQGRNGRRQQTTNAKAGNRCDGAPECAGEEDEEIEQT